MLVLLERGLGKEMELIERREGRKNPRPLRDLSVCEVFVGFEVDVVCGVKAGAAAMVVAAAALATLASGSETGSTWKHGTR